jgi:hypothetical protein
VIRALLLPRFRKSLEKVPIDARAKFQKTLADVSAAFGDPHRHSGLGLRKLGRRSYEIRVHLQRRIVFIHDGENLVAFNIMNHDEVLAWLKGR